METLSYSDISEVKTVQTSNSYTSVAVTTYGSVTEYRPSQDGFLFRNVPSCVWKFMEQHISFSFTSPDGYTATVYR